MIETKDIKYMSKIYIIVQQRQTCLISKFGFVKNLNSFSYFTLLLSPT